MLTGTVRRLLITCVSVAVVIAMTPSRSLALGGSVCTSEIFIKASNTFVCQRWGARLPVDGSGDPDRPLGRPGDGPPTGFVWGSWWSVAWSGSQARDCYFREGGWYLPDVVDDVVLEEGTSIKNDVLVLTVARGEIVACARADIVARATVPEMVDPLRVWDEVSVLLPRPAPSIPPGRAVTGLSMWLVTGRPLEVRIDDAGVADLPGGLVDVTATATFTVDWGDDSVRDGPFDRPGVPYNAENEDDPRGIRHVWTDKGDIVLTVADEWTVAFEDQWGRSDTVMGTLEESLEVPVVEMVMVGS